MIDPVDREKIEAAFLAAMQECGITQAELGRRLGKGSSWIASVLQRIREGGSLTFETVRVVRQQLPKLEEHLRTAGWYSGGKRPGRTVPVTRSTEHLRLYRSQIVLKLSELQHELEQVDEQINNLEAIARGE